MITEDDDARLGTEGKETFILFVGKETCMVRMAFGALFSLMA